MAVDPYALWKFTIQQKIDQLRLISEWANAAQLPAVRDYCSNAMRDLDREIIKTDKMKNQVAVWGKIAETANTKKDVK